MQPRKSMTSDEVIQNLKELKSQIDPNADLTSDMLEGLVDECYIKAKRIVEHKGLPPAEPQKFKRFDETGLVKHFIEYISFLTGPRWLGTHSIQGKYDYPKGVVTPIIQAGNFQSKGMTEEQLEAEKKKAAEVLVSEVKKFIF